MRHDGWRQTLAHAIVGRGALSRYGLMTCIRSLDHTATPDAIAIGWRARPTLLRAVMSTALALPLAACNLTTAGCPNPEPTPVFLNVVENSSGARISRSGIAILIGATSADTANVVNGSSAFTVPPERDGVFTLRVIALGYDVWERQDVLISHIATCTKNSVVSIDARLTNNASSSVSFLRSPHALHGDRALPERDVAGVPARARWRTELAGGTDLR